VRTIQEGLWAGGGFLSYPLTAEPAPGTCGGAHAFAAGALVGVEQGTLGAGVGDPSVSVTISQSPGTLAASVPSIDLVVARVASSGLTIVTVDDDTYISPGVGTLELCKSPADNFVTGQLFNFTVTAPGYSASQSVVAGPGSCNDINNVPAPGPVTITETQKFPYELTSVATLPSNALVSSSPQTLSAVVTTLPNQITTVFFTNATLTGYAKICKVLRSAVDNGLAGQTFTFNVSATFNGSPVPGVPSTVTVTAQSFPNVPCTFLTDSRGRLLRLPLGTIVTATEVVPSDAAVTATTISPSNLDNGSTPGTAVFFVGNSGTSGAGNLGAGTVTQATFTNEGLGRIKVCKSSSTIATGTVFNFTIGGGVGPTQAGVNTFCSLSFTLPVGTVTIRETPVNHVSTTWTDTQGEGGTGTSATVTVPFNTENKVTFDNEINSGQLQVCKQVDTDGSAFAQTQFPLTYSWTGGPAPVTVNLKPTQCTNTITVPTLTPTLTPVQISIFEGTVPVPLATLTNVMVQGPDTVVSAAAPPNHLVGTGGSNSPNEVLNSLEGITDVNFINTAALPGL
jgi:hypothetical protein